VVDRRIEVGEITDRRRQAQLDVLEPVQRPAHARLVLLVDEQVEEPRS
jgi:hypothetical protein